MKTKAKNGLAKRILAMVMAFLMLLSLLPVNTNVVFAADEDYTITVKYEDTTEGTAILVPNATVTIYAKTTEENSQQTKVAEGTTGEDGIATLTKAEGYEIEEGCSYQVECDGYETVTGTIDVDYVSTKTMEVTLTKVRTVTVTGSVKLSAEIEEGTENPFAGISVSLYKKADVMGANVRGTAEDELVKTISADQMTGEYSFENVPTGSMYYVQITSEKNIYKTVKIDVDLTNVGTGETEYAIPEEEGNKLTENKTLQFTFAQQEYVVYVGGTKKTIQPTVTLDGVAVSEGYTITYSSSDTSFATVLSDSNKMDAVVSAVALDPSAEGNTEVTITAVLTGDNYVTQETTFKVIVKAKEENGDFNFIGEDITNKGYYEVDYTEDTKFRIDAAAGLPSVDNSLLNITYEIENPVDTTVAEIDTTGKITIKNVGTAKVMATLNAETVADYLTTTISFQLTVKAIDQEAEISFTENWQAENDTLSFDYEKDKEYDFSATIDNGAQLSYAVSADGAGAPTTVAEVDANGKVKIKNSGMFILTITAKKDNYNDKKFEYTITINKADPKLSWNKDIEGYRDVVINGEFVSDTYDFVEPILKSGVSEDFDLSNVEYKVSVNDLIEIDPTTGVISFVGLLDKAETEKEITVTATIPETDNYLEKSISYTITVKSWNVSDELLKGMYAVSGTETIADSGWYTKVSAEDPIKVTSTDDAKYLLFAEYTASLSEAKNGVASFDVTSLSDGENNKISFYVMDAEHGYISALHTADGIKVDTVTPSLSVEQNDRTFMDWLLYFFKGEDVKDKFVVKVSEKTTTSPVKTYYHIENTADVLDDAGIKAITEWTLYDENTEIKIPVNSQRVIYAKVVDDAGNCAYAHTNGLIADNEAPTITATPSAGAVNGYYTGDVEISVEVTETEGMSGIKEVVYWIGSMSDDKKVTKVSNTVGQSTTQNQLSNQENFEIDVTAADYNTKDGVTVYIQAVDNAGNKSQIKEVHLNICLDKPSISVSYDNNDKKASVDGVDYYDAARKASVTITSRDDVYAKDHVSIIVNGTRVQNNKLVWSSDNKTVYVDFPSSTEQYSFEVRYTDKIEQSVSQAVEKFVIDTDVPTATVTVEKGGIWSQILEKLTFGLWRSTDYEVKAVSSDATSKTTMQYYISNGKLLLTSSELDNLNDNEWKAYNAGDRVSISKEDENRYAVYFKITDTAGHFIYRSTDGFIVDTTKSTVGLEPKIEANDNGYYNNDVDFAVTVREDTATYSGIHKIEYEVICDGEKTQGDVLYKFDKANPEYDELKSSFDTSFTVDAKKNNSKSVTVRVKVTDNAGNIATKECNIKMNCTAPTVKIEYNNNEANLSDGMHFFDALREATVTIIDREDTFNEDAATEAIQAVVLKDKAGNQVWDNGVVVVWSHVKETHIATVKFIKDGYYAYPDGTINYTNKADLSNSDENGKLLVEEAEGTVAPFAFAIDTQKPVDVTIQTAQGTWVDWLKKLFVKIFVGKEEDNVTIQISGNDVTSNVTYYYYISNSENPISETDIENTADWTKYDDTNRPVITEEQRMSIYVKAVDEAGNTAYINSDGIVIDKSEAVIELIPQGTKHDKIYTGDVNVKVKVSDSAISSGIKSVEYWILADGVYTAGKEGEGEKLPLQTVTDKSFADLVSDYNNNILVEAKKNNCSNVEVIVKVTDNAGNISNQSIELDIDITAPTISVKYDNNTPIKMLDEKGYFNAVRTATIEVVERTDHFDAEAFIESIQITTDKTMPSITFLGTTEDKDDVNKAVHKFMVAYTADGNYTFDVSYTDEAGLNCKSNEVVYEKDTVAAHEFAVDTTAPTGTILAADKNWKDWLADILSGFTFGLWSDKSLDIVITAEDVTSPIENIYYYKTSTFTPLGIDELKSITDWVDGEKLTVSEDDIFVVYAKIVDYAGNVTYISSDGIIVDKTKPVVEEVAPEITITPEQPVNGIYNSDVTVDIKVVDPSAGAQNSYSGLKEIRYEVTNMGTVTDSGVLYTFDKTNPAQGELLSIWSEKDIVVNAAKNNSNDVVVKVIATDNAGNTSEKSVSLKIDVTKPAISVSYDNNDADATFADGTYFDANRIATIMVTERNFNSDKVKITITNTDGVVPTVSGWTKTNNGTGNGDDTVYTATVIYSADGDYTFDISCTDLVGNVNTAPDYGTSVAPTSFTIDKTVPVVSISYDNNDVLNDNYYKAVRTATITIHEHNFETSRVIVTITGTDNGKALETLPVISGWSSSQDVHTATISYTADALYTFDIAYNDKAGNAAADVAEQRFYIDKTAPAVSVTEIVDQTAHNEDTISFVIKVTDTNFDVFHPVVEAVTKTENGFKTEKVELGSITDISNGKQYTVHNIDADGIYSIKCTAVDKAGNAYTEVSLQNEDGSMRTASLTSADVLLTFSVNRQGSTFDIDDTTAKLLENYYVQEINDDVVIYEVNVDPLASYTISLNGKELAEGSDYEVVKTGEDSEWAKYTYTIKKSLFETEGEYTIVIASTDKAQNNAFSDVKNSKVSFIVDRTAPTVTISGLKDGGNYKTDNKTVTLIPTDDGGAIYAILVRLVAEDGTLLKELINYEGDALTELLEKNNGEISFGVGEGINQRIQIICKDSSVNEAGDRNTYDEIFTISVSANAFTLFWNTYGMPIMIGGGATAALTASAAGVFVFRKKNKK